VIVPQDALSKISPLYPTVRSRLSWGKLRIAFAAQLRPRLGFAYRPFVRNVFRAHYGIFNRDAGALRPETCPMDPFRLGELLQCDSETDRRFSRFPTRFRVGQDSGLISPAIRPTPKITGRSHQFNFSIERQIRISACAVLRWRARSGSELLRPTIQQASSQSDPLHAEPPPVYAAVGATYRPQRRRALNYTPSLWRAVAEWVRSSSMRTDVTSNYLNYQMSITTYGFEPNALEDPYAPLRMEPRSYSSQIPRRVRLSVTARSDMASRS